MRVRGAAALAWIATCGLAGACGAGCGTAASTRTWLLDVSSPTQTVSLGDGAAGSAELYAPAGCDAATRCGALVWVQPWDRGSLPRAWRPALDDAGLVWIAPNDAGNGRPRDARVALALAAARHATEALGADPARLYAGGLSGGGRVASTAALLRPEVFRGGLFAVGADFFADAPSAHPRVAVWTAAFPAPDPARLALARRRRFVLLTGERDFNRQELHDLAHAYRAFGLDAHLVDVAGMEHALPSAACLALALRVLEEGASGGDCPAAQTP